MLLSYPAQPPRLPHPFDFPPPAKISQREVYLDLTANRFEAARWAVQSWPASSRVREHIEAGRYQEALCLIERQDYPGHGPLAPAVRTHRGIRA